MNPEAMQKPVADEGANDANRRVADETEPVAPHNLACQPSGNEPDDQNDNQPLVRQMHVLPMFLCFEFAAPCRPRLARFANTETVAEAAINAARQCRYDRPS